MLKIPSRLRSFFPSFNIIRRDISIDFFLSFKKCMCLRTQHRLAHACSRPKGNVQKQTFKGAPFARSGHHQHERVSETGKNRTKKWTKDRMRQGTFFFALLSSNILDILLILNYSLLNLFCACFFSFSFRGVRQYLVCIYTFIIFIFPAFGSILSSR